MDLGLVCPVCGQLNLIIALTCNRCSTTLAPAPLPPRGRPATAAAAGTITAHAAQVAPQASRPEQRFDPKTGAGLAGTEQAKVARTMFFGALQQQPVVPRLVVIKGEGGDGATYHLTGTTHVMGRFTGEITFREDPFLSPEHARFTAQQARLFVQDIDSENGVFLRIRKPMILEHRDLFLVGEQLLRLDSMPFSDGGPDAQGTYFYGSPRPDGTFRLVQCLAGGGEGRKISAQASLMTIGREGNHLDFPQDRFISGHHARLEYMPNTGQVLLTDTGSRNGTFIRIRGAHELFHGDYLFVGQQLLRVEIA